MYTHTHIYIYIYTHTHTYIHIYIYIYSQCALIVAARVVRTVSSALLALVPGLVVVGLLA